MAHYNTKTHRSVTFSANKTVFSSFLDYSINICYCAAVSDDGRLLHTHSSATEIIWRWMQENTNTGWYVLIKKSSGAAPVTAVNRVRTVCVWVWCGGGGGCTVLPANLRVAFTVPLRRVATTINSGVLRSDVSSSNGSEAERLLKLNIVHDSVIIARNWWLNLAKWWQKYGVRCPPPPLKKWRGTRTPRTLRKWHHRGMYDEVRGLLSTSLSTTDPRP